MATKKGKKSEEPVAAASSNGVSVYDAAVSATQDMDNDGTRRKVEAALKEGRGQDLVRLHATLTAVDTAHKNVASDISNLHSDVDAAFEKTWEAADKNFEKTWDTADKNFNKTWEAGEENFSKTWKSLDTKFDKTWDSLGQNFDATNERTKREIHDLREEMTKLLDRRFTQIDQTFASIRADIEVLKALQMELIKERIGRPEIMKR